MASLPLPVPDPPQQVFGCEAVRSLPSWELGIEDTYTIDDAVEGADVAARVGKMLRGLTPREERVLRMHFGIGCEEQNLDQIAEQFGVTRERIRQIEAKAFRKLKHPSRARQFRAAPPARAPRRYRQREYIDLDVPVRRRELVPLVDWRSIQGLGPALFAEVDGEMVPIRPTGISIKPGVCADFGGTDAVVLFTHDGQRYGEDWRAVRVEKWTTARGAAFRTKRVRVH